MFTEKNAKLEALQIFDERLIKVKAMREPPELPTGDQTAQSNSHNPDTQYLKSIKINVPNFNRRYDPQLFIDWTLQLDRYFTWYKLN